MKRIMGGYQRMPKNYIRFSCVGLCGTRVTGPLLLGKCHINVGATLKQRLAGYTLGQRWLCGQSYVGPTFFADVEVHCANIGPT